MLYHQVARRSNQVGTGQWLCADGMCGFSNVCSAGKPPTDDAKLGDLQLKPNAKIMMMGTPEEKLVCTSRLIYLTISQLEPYLMNLMSRLKLNNFGSKKSASCNWLLIASEFFSIGAHFVKDAEELFARYTWCSF